MPLDATLRDDLALGEAVLQEFLAADIVVIGVAFYNFSIASQLKAWIDRIAVAGRTFRYTQSGAEGLSGNKHVFLAIAPWGSVYGAGSPRHAMGACGNVSCEVRSPSSASRSSTSFRRMGSTWVTPRHRSVTIAQAQARIDQTVRGVASLISTSVTETPPFPDRLLTLLVRCVPTLTPSTTASPAPCPPNGSTQIFFPPSSRPPLPPSFPRRVAGGDPFLRHRAGP
jgi:hypothetical protein